jgi:hypothetical protein
VYPAGLLTTKFRSLPRRAVFSAACCIHAFVITQRELQAVCRKPLHSLGPKRRKQRFSPEFLSNYFTVGYLGQTQIWLNLLIR